MQEKVLKYELGTMVDAMVGYHRNYNPKILYTFVDKRINTRFAEKEGDTYKNPAPGTVVDTGLVEHPANGTFDFYMIPHHATIATALPVHYYVAKNSTGLRNVEVE